MNYMLCNFLGKDLHKSKKSGFNQVVIETPEGSVSEVELYKDGDTLRFVEQGTEAQGTLVDLIGNLSCEKVGSTLEELEHTEENPIIAIATKGIRVYDNIPVYLKYITLQDGVLVVLLKGFISVLTSDGEEVPLARNCNTEVRGGSHLYKAEEINKWNSLVDKDSDVAYSEYVVNDCLVKRAKRRDSSTVSTSLKFTKESFVVLNQEVFIKGAKRKKELEEKKKEEALRKARAMRMLAEQKASEERAKATKKPRTQKTKKVSSDSQSGKVGSAGAKSFLDYVNSLKNS